jgi:small subunit ribosomal protein S3
MLQEDIKVRDFLKQKLAHAAVGRIVIERPPRMPRSRSSARARAL